MAEEEQSKGDTNQEKKSQDLMTLLLNTLAPMASIYNSAYLNVRDVSRPGFRDRDPGIPGRDPFPFPPLLLPGEPGGA